MPFFTVDTWIGTVSVFFEKEPFLLKRIVLPGSGAANREKNGSEFQSHMLHDFSTCPGAEQVAEMINSYFKSGRPIETPWQLFFPNPLTRLQLQVLQITSKIPYGQVRTYRDIAIKLGKPGAARFVGNTMASNPWPILVACHRVIRSDGTLGGFGGGASMKEKLLVHEAKTSYSMLAH